MIYIMASFSTLCTATYTDMFSYSVPLNDIDVHNNDKMIDGINDIPYVMVHVYDDTISASKQCLEQAVRQLPCVAEVSVIFQGV